MQGKACERKRREITVERTKEILANRVQKLQDIHRKIELLYRELEQLEQADELMAAAAMPARTVEITAGQGEHADNLAILNRFYRQRKERGLEIRLQMRRLSEDAEDIRRLWSCFFVLEEPYYGILYELYVKRELYTSAEAAFGYSHRMFEKRRKEGLELLANLFNSPYSSLELMELASVWGAGGKKGWKKKEVHAS